MEKNNNNLTSQDLEQVSGGYNYDGKFYSLSEGDCFVDPSNTRYRVLENYYDIEFGEEINVYCVDCPSIQQVNSNFLLNYTYVGKNVF